MSQLTRSNAHELRTQNSERNAALLASDYDADAAKARLSERFNCTMQPQGVVNKPFSQSPRKKEFVMDAYAHTLLFNALVKQTDPIHPNYRKALAEKPDRLNDVLTQRILCAKAYDQHGKTQPLRAVIVAVSLCGAVEHRGALMAADLIKQLMRDCTFAANLDFMRAERAEHAVPSEATDASNAALEELANAFDGPCDDVATSKPPSIDDPRHDSELYGTPVGIEPAAPYDGPSTEEICEGIEQVNEWLQAVVRAKFTNTNQRDYFRIDPLPFLTTWDASQGKEYAHESFEDARSALDTAFKRRVSTLAGGDTDQLELLAAM
ncbi:MAG: hypothetical protein KDA57_13960 [Planctomycetales bacterium]|nr:hypothetical protein [Planctomycetales bacterium]